MNRYDWMLFAFRLFINSGAIEKAKTLVARLETTDFLSCLFGSEPRFSVRGAAGPFLSCLFGSEHRGLRGIHWSQFLSCLFGSERRR